MKKLLVVIFVFSIQIINAQDLELERAKRFFDRTYYTEAIQLYEKIVSEKPSTEVVRNLADSYYYTNDFKNAQRYYRLLIKSYNQDLDRNYYFKFAQTLKGTNSYEEAHTVLKEYYSKSANTQDLTKFESDTKTLENVSAIGNRYDIKNLGVNTENSEFGAVKHNDSLIYAAVKKKPGLFDKVYKWDNDTYLNLVSVSMKNIDSKDSIRYYFAKELKTSMHESNIIFTKDGKTIYFTRNNYKNGRRGKNEEKVSNLQIFKAELVNGKWTNVTSLPFNSDNYSVEHPALSSDEKTLYFASDMPGTLGSLDIFSVAVNEGAFGTPQNLGAGINTDKREQFPFVSNDNKLYFSSDGHLGYGSLDVFVSEIKNKEYSKANNVGLPVNSNLDDFAFNIDSDTKEGYFSSNRAEGKGSDDIYQLKEVKDLIIEDCKQFITGIITDVDTKLPLENAEVLLQDANKNRINSVTTTADGKFNFTIACESSYTVLASKVNYTSNSKALVSGKVRDYLNDASMALKSLDVLKLEEDRKQKEALALIALKDAETKANDIAQAEIRKKEKVDQILKEEKDVVKDKDRLMIKTPPIYFDYDLWYIRKESKIILNRVYDLMKKYPGMVVEIGSHTDSRGDLEYNAELSGKRAKSTKEYLVESGIDSKRIIAKGYGESVPIIKCIPDESCTEEQHELNRRSEFVIKNL
ncbi:MAG: OmpA family protein [Bacteroidota bacterium]